MKLLKLCLSFAGNKGLLKESLVENLLHRLAHILLILYDELRCGRKELEEALAVFRLFGKLGNDAYLGEALLAELRVHVKGADAVHIIPEEVNSIRKLATEGIYVKNASAHGKLPRLIDIIHTVESKAEKGFLHEHGIHALALGKAYGLLAQLLAGDHHLGKCGG